ncbi:MAG: rhodanese-like domain-containing protein [Acidobacteriaceae bacterium]|nr:rhodanese-like domain-containing protein [Acidobacteriaceae bacterium]
METSPKARLLTAADLAAEQLRGTLVLDTRPAEQFAALHIRGSIQISLLGYFSAWAAILIQPAQDVVLIAESERSAQEAHNRLAKVGTGNVIGYALANEKNWREQGIELASIATQRCANVIPNLGREPALQLVDVRSRAEWLRGHLPGAISVPLLDLDSNARSVDPSRPSLVYCHEGYRATTAASILLRASTTNVGILIDGIEGWSACGLPLEIPNSECKNS